jgi:hypothetical protein
MRGKKLRECRPWCAPQRARIGQWATFAASAALIIGAFFVGQKNLERERLISWAESYRSDTAEEIEMRFIRCKELQIVEAVPFAALYAVCPIEVDGRTQWHVVAARSYLRGFSFDEIEKLIEEKLKHDPRNTPSFRIALRKATQ